MHEKVVLIGAGSAMFTRGFVADLIAKGCAYESEGDVYFDVSKAKDYGKLIGVSGLTVYHWEAGKAKPRRRQLPAIAAVRGLGKREAAARLAGKK